MARMELGQNLRQSQEMQLQITPQQIMAANLLQLQQMSLEARIQQELEDNPALELAPRNRDNATAPGGETAEPAEDEPEVDPYRERSDDLDRRYVAPDDDADKQHMIEATQARRKTLGEHLREQLWELAFTPEEMEIADMIIINLTAEGFLALDAEGVPLIFKDPRYTEPAVRAVLEQIRSFDPPGIATATHRESLLAQLDRLEGDYPVARRILEAHYDDLLMNRIPKIAVDTGIGIDGVKDAIDVIRRFLTPAPGAEFAIGEPLYIIPDVVVSFEDGRFEVRLNNDMGDGVRISGDFKRRLKESVGDQREYFKERLVSASMLIKAIEQRRETLLKISHALVEAQREWFEDRRASPVGITRYDIARVIGVHHSTVSRGVMDKYIQTPRGIFPFSHFFGGSLDVRRAGSVAVGAVEDDEASVKEIKRVMDEILTGEDKHRPLSDSRIQRMLVERTGVMIARRTVAKYRESMGVLSSSKRKQY
ncbi:MAG: RNA polymerase factor sigma-54 [Planctomycetota bacterium]